MPGSYSPILGARWGNTADCQGFASNRFVAMDCGGAAMNDATLWNATPLDGALGYKSTVNNKHLIFHDTALAVNADVLVPRIDAGYNEQVLGQWAFAYNPGGASSFTVASTTVVTNLNADLLDGFNTAQTSTASTVAVRDANARLLVSAPSGAVNDEVVNYGFLYSFVAGVRDPKQACLVIYPTVLPAFTFNAGAETITADAFGSINPVDGQTLAVNDRIGIVFETVVTTKKPYNGIYIVTQVGTAGTPFILQRAADADTDAEITNGMQFWVTTGTTYGDSGWLLTTPDPITHDVTDLTFVQNNGTAGITAGNGIVKVGNTIHAVQSAAYTTGGIVYANAATTLTLFTTAGVVQATSGAAPTAATGTQYGVPYWSASTTLGTSAAPGSATVVLHGAVAGAPTWSAVSLTADVSGTLPVANGGTGAVTLTGILYGNGTSAITAGNGTAGTIAKFSASSPGLSNSIMVETASLITIAGGITLTGAQTIQTSTGILTVTGTSGLTLTSGTSNTVLTQNSVNVFTSEGFGAIANTLYLKAGQAGIGTTAPSGKLQVANLSGSGQIYIDGTDASNTWLGFMSGQSIKWLIGSNGNTAGNLFTIGKATGLDTSTPYLSILNSSGNIGIATTAPSTLLHLGLAGTTLGTLGFAGNTSGLITMNSAAVAGTWTFTLPTSGGTANYALITNGSGVSSWSILPAAGGGTGRAAFYYTTTFGDGLASTFTITHSLGTRDVHVTIYATATPWQELDFAVIKHTSTTTITIELGFVPAAAEFTVCVT